MNSFKYRYIQTAELTANGKRLLVSHPHSPQNHTLFNAKWELIWIIYFRWTRSARTWRAETTLIKMNGGAKNSKAPKNKTGDL